MKTLKKSMASFMCFSVIAASSFTAHAAPLPTNINNNFYTNQQVILENINAQVVNIMQTSINLSVNVAPTIAPTIAPTVNIDLDLSNIGQKNIGPKF